MVTIRVSEIRDALERREPVERLLGAWQPTRIERAGGLLAYAQQLLRDVGDVRSYLRDDTLDARVAHLEATTAVSIIA